MKYLWVFFWCPWITATLELSRVRGCWLPIYNPPQKSLSTSTSPSTPPSSFSLNLNLHNRGWSRSPFGLHNSWAWPWQLLYHWLAKTHGTPLCPHPWDILSWRDKGSEGLQRGRLNPPPRPPKGTSLADINHRLCKCVIKTQSIAENYNQGEWFVRLENTVNKF